jgi:hypothetical protein
MKLVQKIGKKFVIALGSLAVLAFGLWVGLIAPKNRSFKAEVRVAFAMAKLRELTERVPGFLNLDSGFNQRALSAEQLNSLIEQGVSFDNRGKLMTSDGYVIMPIKTLPGDIVIVVFPPGRWTELQLGGK